MKQEIQNSYPLSFMQMMELIEHEDTAEIIAKKTYNQFPIALITDYLEDRQQAEKELGQTTIWSQVVRGCVGFARDKEDLIKKATGREEFDLETVLSCWEAQEARWARIFELRTERLSQAQEQARVKREAFQKAKQARIQETMASLSNGLNKLKANKDMSADQRAEYSRKISQKEQEMDDLRHLKQHFENSNERFSSNVRRHFEEVEEDFYRRSQYPSQQSRWQQAVVQEAYAQMQFVTEQQNEVFEDSCRITRRNIEDKIEELHKERNALPW
ncbi:hypothetical protein ACFO26_01595 [Lactococcus nasutitermitis]|uniref:Uncharacterized protein n=1 Tax=Lactococcus nasutitermitis TaxID=1652957 RepID=A0ABV9JAR7_9LACT|nr:hypothetical protein [Lactococcus nasutitermitis]